MVMKELGKGSVGKVNWERVYPYRERRFRVKTNRNDVKKKKS